MYFKFLKILPSTYIFDTFAYNITVGMLHNIIFLENNYKLSTNRGGGTFFENKAVLIIH